MYRINTIVIQFYKLFLLFLIINKNFCFSLSLLVPSVPPGLSALLSLFLLRYLRFFRVPAFYASLPFFLRVLKASKLRLPEKSYGSDGAVSLLRYDELRFVRVLRIFIVIIITI